MYLATAAQKRWSPESHSLGDDDVYFMDIGSDDKLSLNDSNFKQKVILPIFMNFVKLITVRVT